MDVVEDEHRPDTSYSLPSGFQTDTSNSARVSGRAGDSYSLPRGFQTDTVNSARVAPVVVQAPSGFDWPSFGIGLGAGVGGLALLAGLAIRVRPFRRLASA